MVVPSSDHSFSIAPGSKVAKLLTDNSTTVAYDTAIDINIESASFSKEFFQDEVRQDGQVGDKCSEFDKISGSFTLAKMDLEALAMLTGNEVTTDGDNKYIDFKSTNKPPYFGFAFKSTYSSSGEVADKHYILHKCKLTGLDMGGGDRVYNKPVVNFEAIPRTNDNSVWKPLFNATAADVTFDSVSS